MKILIISFDKRLSEELKKVFAKEDVIVVKNSEEALKIAPTHVDIVVYDAISGAISEDDINNLYQKKFSDSRYVILFDELFPVNKDNLMPQDKVLVPREEDPKKVKEIALSFDTEPSTAQEEKPQEQPQTTEEAPKEEEVPPLDDSLIELSHVPEVEPEEPQSPTETQPPVEPEPEIELTPIVEGQEEEPPTTEETTTAEVPVQEETISKKRKALLVSFDATLIDSVKEILGSEYEIETVKNTRQAIERGEDSDIVIYDAISGVIAEKGLTELSENPKFSTKPYLVLVDDLFPIDVDSIPLTLKKSLSRDSRENLKALVEELILQAEASSIQEEPQLEQEPQPQITEEPPTVVETQMEAEEEEIPALENLDKIVEELEKGMPEGTTEQKTEQEEQETTVEPVEELSESVPPIEELAKEVVESTEPEVSEQTQPPAPVEVPQVSEGISAESLANVEEIIRKAVKEKLESVNVEGLITKLIRESVREALTGVDVAQIVREETAKILKQKVEELLK